MKIASEDLQMLEATASQEGDGQQSPGDTADSLNMDPPAVDLLDKEDFHKDPMNVDDLPIGLTADVGADAESAEDRPVDAEGQLEGREEAPLTGKDDAQQEQSDLSSEDLPMTKVHEEAPLTGEGVSQKEYCDPSSGDLPMTEASPADLVDSMITEEPSHQSPLRVTAIVLFNPPPASTQREEIP